MRAQRAKILGFLGITKGETFKKGSKNSVNRTQIFGQILWIIKERLKFDQILWKIKERLKMLAAKNLKGGGS